MWEDPNIWTNGLRMEGLILENLDRRDIIARVFHEKQTKFLWLLKEERIFGELKAWVIKIEWHKRGHPRSLTLWFSAN